MPLEHWDFLRHDFDRILGPSALGLQLEQIPFVRCTPIKLNEKHIEQFRENNFRDSIFWHFPHLPHFWGTLKPQYSEQVRQTLFVYYFE